MLSFMFLVIIIIIIITVLIFSSSFGYNFLNSTQNYGKLGQYSRWQSWTQGGSKKKK